MGFCLGIVWGLFEFPCGRCGFVWGFVLWFSLGVSLGVCSRGLFCEFVLRVRFEAWFCSFSGFVLGIALGVCSGVFSAVQDTFLL